MTMNRKRGRQRKSQPRGWKDKIRLANKMRLRPTPAEAALKKALERAHIPHEVQFLVEPYIVDFFIDRGCRGRFAIEVDGSSHRKRRSYDDRRTIRLQEWGIDVVRVSNDFVLADGGVAAVEHICQETGARAWWWPSHDVEPDGRELW